MEGSVGGKMQPNRPSSADAAMYGLHQRVQTTLHTSGLHANYRVLQSPSCIVKLVASRATLFVAYRYQD